MTARVPRPLGIPLAVALAVTLVVGASGCGVKSNPLRSDTEGNYLRVGHLKYQVQLSRQLNAADPEDSEYLRGLTPADQALAPNQAWFAVWMRVENPSPQPRDPALSFTITDTQGKVYQPIVPDQTNIFAYRATSIPANGQIPDLSSHAYNSPPQGALILFKVNVPSYDNRPLTLAISDPASGQVGRVDLDV
jgi:hypothetical protein